MSKKSPPPKDNKTKKNKQYIEHLDQRLSNNQILANKATKLERLREEELKRQLRDRPELSKGTQMMMKNQDIKNVFDRQQALIHYKEIDQRQATINQRYREIHKPTTKPEINVRSQSMKRTIEDLYLWEEKKQK